MKVAAKKIVAVRNSRYLGVMMSRLVFVALNLLLFVHVFPINQASAQAPSFNVLLRDDVSNSYALLQVDVSNPNAASVIQTIPTTNLFFGYEGQPVVTTSSNSIWFLARVTSSSGFTDYAFQLNSTGALTGAVPLPASTSTRFASGIYDCQTGNAFVTYTNGDVESVNFVTGTTTPYPGLLPQHFQGSHFDCSTGNFFTNAASGQSLDVVSLLNQFAPTSISLAILSSNPSLAFGLNDENGGILFYTAASLGQQYLLSVADPATATIVASMSVDTLISSSSFVDTTLNSVTIGLTNYRPGGFPISRGLPAFIAEMDVINGTTNRIDLPAWTAGWIPIWITRAQ